MTELIGGIDEAGRGPVIGPMVIAGYFIPEEKLIWLSEMILRDSKGYSPCKRERLFRILLSEKDSKIAIITISPSIIDIWVSKLDGLNEMEAYFISQLIRKIKPRRAYIDSCDNDPDKFKRRLNLYLYNYSTSIITEVNADKIYPIVRAASIIAKVIRDNHIEYLKQIYGDIGSGYPSDNRTIKFIKNWIKKSNYLPPIVRRSWKTISKI